MVSPSHNLVQHGNLSCIVVRVSSCLLDDGWDCTGEDPGLDLFDFDLCPISRICEARCNRREKQVEQLALFGDVGVMAGDGWTVDPQLAPTIDGARL